MFRYSVFLLGIILALPILAAISLAIGLPITISGIGYLLGGALVAVGLILFPWVGRNSFWPTISGIILVALVASLRLIFLRQDATSTIRMLTLPERRETRWISALIDEQDGLIVGEALFHLIGGDSPTEHKDLASSLRENYSKIKATQPVFPSPIVSTYLKLQAANDFDTVVIRSETNHSPEFALVFLHGYMGNVTAQCWEIAQAIKTFGAMTVCPSTDWKGDWWQLQGQAILQATLTYLREQGIQSFYLGGFSNGGISLGRLASLIKKEKGLRGLIFIDGMENGAGIRELGLPVLVLQGSQDERIPAPYARQFADELVNLGTYVEVDGDHFLIMKRPNLVQNAIAKWFETREAKQ